MGSLQDKKCRDLFLFLLLLYYMSLYHLPTLIHTKTSTLTFPSKPSATIPLTPYFRRL